MDEIPKQHDSCSKSFNSMIAEGFCKIAQLYDFRCFNLIWVWGIWICRETSDSGPLVAVICILKMAANWTSWSLSVMRKHDGWSFLIHFEGQKGVRMFKNMSEKIFENHLNPFLRFLLRFEAAIEPKLKFRSKIVIWHDRWANEESIPRFSGSRKLILASNIL